MMTFMHLCLFFSLVNELYMFVISQRKQNPLFNFSLVMQLQLEIKKGGKKANFFLPTHTDFGDTRHIFNVKASVIV